MLVIRFKQSYWWRNNA